MDIRNNNKDVQVLKKEIWTRRTTAEVIILKRDKTIDNLKIIKEIQWNNTKEQEV